MGISKEIGAEALGFDSAAFMLIAADEARPVAAYNDARLAEYAERLYKERRRRSRYLPGHLFAEPAWDILLDLFVNGVRDRAISITSACIAGGIPATTGLRWLGVLEKEGLLVRGTSEEDARVTWVQLSDYGMDVMRGYLSEAMGLPVSGRVGTTAVG
ncbi:MAG: MarR family transcriptional regulator [Novosphingobium sp.]